MRSSYDSYLPSEHCISSHAKSRDQSSHFLTCIKSLVRHPLSGSRLPHRPRKCNKNEPERMVSQAVENNRQPHSFSLKLSLGLQASPRRRRQVPVISIADYLTLAQLENLWHQQDTHKGDTEIARIARDQLYGRSTTQSRGQPATPRGNIHPAFRPRQICSHEGSGGLTASCHCPCS